MLSLVDAAGAVALGATAALLGTPTGVSGATLLLPAQLTLYGLSGTTASATNLVFNVVSTPAGIARHLRAGQIDRVLAGLLIAGAVPCCVLGALVNALLLPNPRLFRVLVAVLLGAVALSLLVRLRTNRSGAGPGPDSGSPAGTAPAVIAPAVAGAPTVVAPAVELRPRSWLGAALVLAGAASGLLGGFYGLGGAVLAAPLALHLTRAPVARVSGAALVATLSVSITGAATYGLLDLTNAVPVTTPNWPLGLALGVGGFAGSYLAARFAPRVPDRVLRVGLAALILAAAGRLATI